MDQVQEISTPKVVMAFLELTMNSERCLCILSLNPRQSWVKDKKWNRDCNYKERSNAEQLEGG